METLFVIYLAIGVVASFGFLALIEKVWGK